MTWCEPPYEVDVIIGIDPGKSGGICELFVKEPAWSDAYSMPRKGKDVDYYRLADKLHKVNHDNYGAVVAILEQQWARPSDAKGAAFRYGEHYGHLQQALLEADIFTRYVTPMKWTAALDVGQKSDHVAPGLNDAQVHAAWKRHLRDRAKYWHPDLNATLKTGDAILLAEYGNLLHQKGLLLCQDERRTKGKGKPRSAKPSQSTKATRRRRRKS